MKCPKCSLVTFDHLSKCPRCETSFGLHRRLTRRRNDPSRPILIPRETGELPSRGGPDGQVQSEVHGRPGDDAGGPRLSDLAASERETEIEVKVSAAVEAARATLRDESGPADQAAVEARTSASEPTDATAPATPGHDETEPPQELGETQRIKERMKRAGRARRRKRPDYSTETTDPVLPDWYEPDLEAEEGESPAARSTNRR